MSNVNNPKFRKRLRRPIRPHHGKGTPNRIDPNLTRGGSGSGGDRATPKVGRNDPCPCGSGTKFKRCCGSVRSAPKVLPTHAGPVATSRECGECTACCTVLGVPEVPTEAGCDCEHAMAGGGCAVYEARPRPCRDYSCEWLRGNLPESARPDVIGMVVDDGVSPRFRAKWGPDAVTVREVWPDAHLEGQASSVVNDYYIQGAAIFVVRAGGDKGRSFICADPAKQEMARQIIAKGGRS